MSLNMFRLMFIFTYGCSYVNGLQNVAFGKSAYQTDDYYSAVADRAVDGNTADDYFTGSCSHTYSETDAWWEVDLERIYKIDHVTIYNRMDCCSERLTDVQLFVGYGRNNDDYSLRGVHHGVIGLKHTFQMVTPVYGRWVKITRYTDVGELQLCEVMVFGEAFVNVRFEHGNNQIGTGTLLESTQASTKIECCLRCKTTDKCSGVNYDSVFGKCDMLETVTTLTDFTENNFFYRLP